MTALGITWPAGHLAFHPGPKGEYSVVRWTAPAAGAVDVTATFTGLAEKATTDVHVLHRGRALFDGLLNLSGAPNEAGFHKTVTVAAGDTIDCVVGWGNGSYGGDTTGLIFTLKTADKVYDATAEFSAESNPHGTWSYGTMKPGAAPDAATFARYPGTEVTSQLGSLSNPGSNVWEDVVSDRHVYPPCRIRATPSIRSASSTPTASRCFSRNTASAARSTCGAACGITSSTARRAWKTPSISAPSSTATWPTGGNGVWTNCTPGRKISSWKA